MPLLAAITPRVVAFALAAGLLIGTGTIAANAGEAPRPGAAGSDPPVVDMLMLYSPGALHGAGSEARLRDIAERSAAGTNAAFVNSEANVRTRIVGVVAAPDYPTDLPERSAGYQYLYKTPPSVARLRDEYRADVVGVFAADTGGFSNAVPRPVPATSPDEGAMLLVGWDRAEQDAELYISHELGHLLGLAHDGDDGTGGPEYRSARGYIPPSMNWRDIMAYASTCERVGRKCPMIPYFSNPRLTYQGEPLGVPKGQPGEADAVSMLNESAPIVAAYR